MYEDLIGSNENCPNYTSEEVKTNALALGVPGLICFTLSVVGLIMEFIYVCRNKNNFMLRLFIYLSVAVTISVGAYSLDIAIYLKPNKKLVLCAVSYAIFQYSAMVERFLVFSINIILLHKVYYSTFRSHKPKWPRICNLSYTARARKCLEVMFVTLHFGLPAIVISLIIGIIQEPENWIIWDFCYTGKNSESDTDCALRRRNIFLELLLHTLLLTLIDLLLSLACISILLIWLAWLQKRQFLKARMNTILKETGLLLGYLITYCLAWILVSTMQFIENETVQVITTVLYPLGHAVIPISFFVYMCAGLRCEHRQSHIGNKENQNVHINPHTTRLQIAPLSSRISLPSDTADHAPNLLTHSGEEPSEITPLIVN